MKRRVMTSAHRRSLNGALLVVGAALCHFGCGGGTPPPPISVNALSSAQTIDESRSAAITATVVNDTANKGVTWSLSGSACSGAACGTLSNKTATSATYTAPGTVTANLVAAVVATSVADSTKSATVLLTVVPPPSVSTRSLPDGTGGTAYTATLQESGGVPPFSWTVTSGSLPTGFSLSAEGTIAGTPCTQGTSSFTAQVADSGNPPLTASAPLSISVTVAPLSITTTSLPDGVTDTIYSQVAQASGGISPYTWKLSNGALPSWATLNSSTGRITGIPATPGTANFSLQVADSECTAVTLTQALSLSVVSQTSANDSELSGHYAFLFHGFDDATGSQVAVVGSFTADGKGNITGGIQDENGPNGPVLNVPLTGTYDIGSDHRGAFTLMTASGSKTYAVVLNSVSSGVAHKARFVEFDDTTGTNGQRGAGLLRLQDPSAFSLSSFTGPYAFGFSGQDAAGKRDAIVGSFTADGAGTISSGIVDQNVAGITTNPSLSGTYSAPTTSDGRASLILNPSGASSLNLAAYVVSPSELLVMRTDAFSSEGLVSGTILSQASTSFDNTALDSPAVYYELGADSASPSKSIAEVGLMTADGKGGVTFNTDSSNGTAIGQNQTFPATYSVLNAGRVTVTASQTSLSWILYLANKNQGFLLDTSGNVGFGFVEPQAVAPTGGFANSSLSGTFSAGSTAPSVAANANATGLATLDGAGSFSESATLSNTSGLFVNDKTAGTYAVSSNGRGTVTGLTISIAGIGGSQVVIPILVWLLLGCVISRRKLSRPALAMLLLVALIMPMLVGCRITNQFVFYMVSPTKAVMMHQASSDTAPGITIIDQ